MLIYDSILTRQRRHASRTGGWNSAGVGHRRSKHGWLAVPIIGTYLVRVSHAPGSVSTRSLALEKSSADYTHSFL